MSSDQSTRILGALDVQRPSVLRQSRLSLSTLRELGDCLLDALSIERAHGLQREVAHDRLRINLRLDSNLPDFVWIQLVSVHDSESYTNAGGNRHPVVQKLFAWEAHASLLLVCRQFVAGRFLRVGWVGHAPAKAVDKMPDATRSASSAANRFCFVPAPDTFAFHTPASRV